MAAMLVSFGGTPTWRIHIKSCNFLNIVFPKTFFWPLLIEPKLLLNVSLYLPFTYFDSWFYSCVQTCFILSMKTKNSRINTSITFEINQLIIRLYKQVFSDLGDASPRSTDLIRQISPISTERLTKEVSSCKFGRRTRRNNSMFGVSAVSSFFALLSSVTSTSCQCLQRTILRNSLRNAGFIPAYMKGLIVFDK